MVCCCLGFIPDRLSGAFAHMGAPAISRPLGKSIWSGNLAGVKVHKTLELVRDIFRNVLVRGCGPDYEVDSQSLENYQWFLHPSRCVHGKNGCKSSFSRINGRVT